MQLNNFSGGLSLRLSPHLLGQDEAQEYVNIDPTRGTLTPLKKETLVEGIEPTDSAIYYYKDKWVFSPTPTNYVEFLDILFRDRVDDSPQMTIDGENWYNIGIAAPEQRPELILAETTRENSLYIAYAYRGKAPKGTYTHRLRNIPRGGEVIRVQAPGRYWITTFSDFIVETPVSNDAYSTLSAVRPIVGTLSSVINIQTSYYNKTIPTITSSVVFNEAEINTNRTNAGSYWNGLPSDSLWTQEVWGHYPLVTGRAVFTLTKNAIPEFIDILVSTDNTTFKRAVTFDIQEATKLLSIAYKDLAGASEIISPDVFEQEVTTSIQTVGYHSRLQTTDNYANRLISEMWNTYEITINNDIGNTTTVNLKSKLEGLDTSVLYTEVTDSGSGGSSSDEDSSNPLYEYVYTYYSQITGAESAPSPIAKKHVNFLLQEVRLKCVPSKDPQVTNIRVYRRGNTIEDWGLVSITENTGDYIIDNKVDTNIYGDPLESNGNILAPNVKYLVNANTSLYGVIDNNIYFSYDAQPTKWSLLNFISFDSTVTGLCATTNGVLVFTLYRTYVVVGKTVDTLSKYLLDGTVGCISNASIQVYQGYSIWYSHIGVCISSGSDITRIGWEKLGENDLIPASDIICSTVYNNVYYLLYKYNDTTRVLVLDNTTRRLVFRHLDILLDSLSFAKDGLYGVKDKKLYQLFTSEENMTMVWKSPNYADNSVNNLKNYKTIYISSEGDAVINIYIDDKEVMTDVPLTKGLNEIKIPQQYRLGYHITFKIVSDYVIKEIEYKTEERQNGR